MLYLDDLTFALMKIHDNEDITMLPDNMFVNLIDTDLQEKLQLTE
jgi:hypothetical protein